MKPQLCFFLKTFSSFSYTGAFTLDVIASTAFGMELDSQNDSNNPFITHAKKLFAIKLTDPLVLAIRKFYFCYLYTKAKF